jgi:hypothetical protein
MYAKNGRTVSRNARRNGGTVSRNVRKNGRIVSSHVCTNGSTIPRNVQFQGMYAKMGVQFQGMYAKMEYNSKKCTHKVTDQAWTKYLPNRLMKLQFVCRYTRLPACLGNIAPLPSRYYIWLSKKEVF